MGSMSFSCAEACTHGYVYVHVSVYVGAYEYECPCTHAHAHAYAYLREQKRRTWRTNAGKTNIRRKTPKQIRTKRIRTHTGLQESGRKYHMTQKTRIQANAENENARPQHVGETMLLFYGPLNVYGAFTIFSIPWKMSCGS